jgi:hypothetical protein
MSNYYYDATEEDLKPLRQAAGELRSYWAKMDSPRPASFEGERSDIEALDWLDYEGISLPSSGLEGASLIWGEVIRKALEMKWVVSYRGDLMIASVEEDDPCRKLIWPFARIFEVQQRRFPQFGKYNWTLQQIVVDLLTFFSDDEEERKLMSLVDPEDRDFLTRIAEIQKRWK